MSKKIAGTIYIKVDGEQLSLSGDIEVPLTTEQRETKLDVAGNVVGYSANHIAPYVKMTSYFLKDFPIDKVAKEEDLTVHAAFSNGKVYVLSGAHLVGETPVNPGEATVPLQFDGESGRWM